MYFNDHMMISSQLFRIRRFQPSLPRQASGQLQHWAHELSTYLRSCCVSCVPNHHRRGKLLYPFNHYVTSHRAAELVMIFRGCYVSDLLNHHCHGELPFRGDPWMIRYNVCAWLKAAPLSSPHTCLHNPSKQLLNHGLWTCLKTYHHAWPSRRSSQLPTGRSSTFS